MLSRLILYFCNIIFVQTWIIIDCTYISLVQGRQIKRYMLQLRGGSIIFAKRRHVIIPLRINCSKHLMRFYRIVIVYNCSSLRCWSVDPTVRFSQRVLYSAYGILSINYLWQQIFNWIVQFKFHTNNLVLNWCPILIREHNICSVYINIQFD